MPPISTHPIVPFPIRPFHYRVRWRPRARRPGEHAAALAGEGDAFRGERLLTEASQARQLSVAASIRDPLRRLWAREYQQRAAIDVLVVADVSRSMRIGAEGGPCRVLGDLVASAALSAFRGGDRIGVVCASTLIDPHLVVAPTRLVQPVLALAQCLRDLGRPSSLRQPGLDSVDGLLDAWRRLPARRCLVFVVSDFHAPIATWTRIFSTLRHHDVVPTVLADGLSLPELPRWGLVSLHDAESGQSRPLLMRASLQRRLKACVAQRRHELSAMFEGLGLRPAYLREPFDPAQLTEYFHGAAIRGNRKSLPRPTPASEPAAGSTRAPHRSVLPATR